MFAGYGHNGVPAVPPPSRATYGNEPTSCARAYTLYCTVRTDAPREDLHVLVHCTSTAPRAQPRSANSRRAQTRPEIQNPIALACADVICKVTDSDRDSDRQKQKQRQKQKLGINTKNEKNEKLKTKHEKNERTKNEEKKEKSGKKKTKRGEVRRAGRAGKPGRRARLRGPDNGTMDDTGYLAVVVVVEEEEAGCAMREVAGSR